MIGNSHTLQAVLLIDCAALALYNVVSSQGKGAVRRHTILTGTPNCWAFPEALHLHEEMCTSFFLRFSYF